jgi:hypothetical protein
MMAKLIVVLYNRKTYPECNTQVYRNNLADELDKICAALRNVKIGTGIKDDFRDGVDYTAMFIAAVGSNGKCWHATFGIDVPAKDTGLGS